MEVTTLLWAKIISIYLIVSGIGFLVSRDFYIEFATKSDQTDPMAVNISGMVHFFIGMAILTTHFVWTSVLGAVVTLFGFSFIIRGALYIIIPKTILRASEASAKSLPMAGTAFVIAGGLMGYFAFFG